MTKSIPRKLIPVLRQTRPRTCSLRHRCPLQSPHWHRQDQLSNHRTANTAEPLRYDVQTEVWGSHRFLLAVPYVCCFSVLGQALGTPRHRVPARPDPEQRLMRPCNSYCWGDPRTGIWNLEQRTQEDQGLFPVSVPLPEQPRPHLFSLFFWGDYPLRLSPGSAHGHAPPLPR